MNNTLFTYQEYSMQVAQKLNRYLRNTADSAFVGLRYFLLMTLLFTFMLPKSASAHPLKSLYVVNTLTLTSGLQDATYEAGSARYSYGHIGCIGLDINNYCTSGKWLEAPKIDGARWVWKERLVTPQEAVAGETVNFSRIFDLPYNAYGINAKITITADNVYEVLVHDGTAWRLIGSDSNWGTVETYNFSARPGANYMHIRVQNYGIPGSNSYTNPAGLIYKVTVTYFLR